MFDSKFWLILTLKEFHARHFFRKVMSTVLSIQKSEAERRKTKYIHCYSVTLPLLPKQVEKNVPSVLSSVCRQQQAKNSKRQQTQKIGLIFRSQLFFEWSKTSFSSCVHVVDFLLIKSNKQCLWNRETINNFSFCTVLYVCAFTCDQVTNGWQP